MRRFWSTRTALLCLCLFCLSTFCLLRGLSTLQAEANALQQQLSDEVLRLHILANSDSVFDQDDKGQVRDALLVQMAPLLSDTSSKSEAVSLVTTQLPRLKVTADTVLAAAGSADRATVSIERCYFPTRTYGDVCLPCGMYDAVRVTIGAAAGHNWWCVMYPALCFTDPVLQAAEPDSVESADAPPAAPVFRFRIFTFLNRFMPSSADPLNPSDYGRP